MYSLQAALTAALVKGQPRLLQSMKGHARPVHPAMDGDNRLHPASFRRPGPPRTVGVLGCLHPAHQRQQQACDICLSQLLLVLLLLSRSSKVHECWEGRRQWTCLQLKDHRALTQHLPCRTLLPGQ